MKADKLALLIISILITATFSGCIDVEINDSDFDKDGVPNDQDAFPYDPSEQNDSDGDFVGDNADKFPYDPAASADTDGDGYPNQWNPEKNQSDSTSIPPLELDDFPFDPDEWKDSDDDGVGDNSDIFPDNPNEWSDADKDGVGDNSDVNSNVDLSIDITIEKFKVTGRVDILRWAQIYFVIKINGKEVKRIDNDGKSWNVKLNEEKQVDQVFHYNIPDTTRERYTDIELVMYDSDFILNDDIVDISDKVGEKTIRLKFDNVKNTVSFDTVSKGSEGTIWYDITTAEEVVPPVEAYNRIYRWNFDDKNWEFNLEIPVDTYNDYKYADVNRRPQNIGNKAMASFVTPDERIVRDAADELEFLFEPEDYDEASTANFVLRFVQKNVIYANDNDTQGCIEYWRYPVETLVDKKGDCEDTTVLFASIMEALGYDTVLLFYHLEDDLGHLATGIHVDGNPEGEYVIHKGQKYYYCETTTVGYTIGELPPDIEGKPDKIIPV